MSIGLLNELLKEKWSENLAGGILESFGRLFKSNVALYVYPWKNRKTGEFVTAKVFSVEDHLRHLFLYFKENNMINDVECSDENLLEYTGGDLLKMIKDGNDSWKDVVPERAHKVALYEAEC